MMSYIKKEDLCESQKKNRLIKLPSLVEYFDNCLCCGSHFAGPVYEVKDYLVWTEGKWLFELYSKLPFAMPCMSTWCLSFPYPDLLAICTRNVVFGKEWATFTARWKYYFIWSISEACREEEEAWYRGCLFFLFLDGYRGCTQDTLYSLFSQLDDCWLKRWQQAFPPNKAFLKNILVFYNFAYTVLVLNYFCISFMVLSLHETLVTYGST